MRNPLRKQQLLDLGLVITAQDDVCYAGLLRHKQLNKQFDIIYNFNGLLSIEFEKIPLVSKAVFSERGFMMAINQAQEIHEKKEFDKSLLLHVKLEYQLEFSAGKYHLKYNLDPITSLIAFEITKESLRSVVEKDILKPKEKRLSIDSRRTHIAAVKILEEISMKLAIVVKEQAESKQNTNIQTVSPDQAQQFLTNVKGKSDH